VESASPAAGIRGEEVVVARVAVVKVEAGRAVEAV
jgi:hypothetical protein